jgi:hypothetical protein
MAFLRAAYVPAQTAEIDASKFQWTNLSPKDTTARYAILHVDSVTGATQMVYSLPPNTTSPCHWPSASQGSVVAQGSETVWHAATREGTTLAVGGFSFVPARTPFRLRTGATKTMVLVSMEGRFDIHFEPDERCDYAPSRDARAALPFEIDLSNATWTEFPTKGSGVFIAKLYIDSTSGAAPMLFRIPPNDTSPCHWHSGGESNFVVQGVAGMRHAGMADRASLISTGPTPTLVYSALDARFDFHPVDDTQCR